ncbi:MAG: lamin tail domain-containing protein, partial [Sedimentisphaerales bacterium]|nr:lamin tail domain-containing protein [Sedimentisphaerales bacterium]
THGLPTIPGKTGGVGYETRPGDSTNFVNYITYDVESEMDDTNPGCYIRIPFTLEPAQIDGCTQMSLSMRYDDGFIAYINGTEVASVYAPSNPQYNSAATGQHGDSGAILFQNFDISSHIGLLHSGENILAIHGLNVYSGSSDFLASAVLSVSKSQGIPGAISPTAIQYTGPITLNQSTELKARTKDGSNWSALNRTTCAIGPVKENLRITELMYHPLDPNKDNPDIELAEYIELKNISGTALNIGLAKFTEGVQFTFPQGTIIPEDGYLILAKDPTIFTNTYGQLPLGVELLSSYLGYLDNSGERIKLEDPIGQTILDFEYKDSWRTITDGDGFSLTIINPANADVNSWSKKDSWRSSARIYGSAGDDDSSLTHNPGDIVINELLAHSHDIAPDWIELYNTTPSSIDISGWYLSDSDSDDPNIKKYKIPHSTNIPANGYVVFYEDTQFGNPSDPCCLKPFALSENGETAYLRSGLDANGFLTGYKEKESFGASDEGVSFGRYEKSTGTYNFVAMQYPTPGTLNSDPNVGPIVINEIMYNPSLFDQDAEYIELHNITAGNIDLYDELGLRWKFTDGIDFTFPSNTSISANGFVVIAKNPTVFTSTYGSLPGGAVLFGPYDGQLSNGGEKLELSKPGDTDELGKRYYIRIDRVSYSDGSHHEDFDANDPWPIGCDGTGLSLSKKTSSDYGNDPIAWESSAPSPGQQNP